MKEYIKGWKNSFNYTDRASRRDFWMFIAINMAVSFGIGVIVGLLKLPLLVSTLYGLASIFPIFALCARRAHDTNRSGWFMLIPVYSLYLLFVGGDKVANRFGPPPVRTQIA